MAPDTETAEWASDQTGEVQKAVTRMEGIQTNDMGGEEWEKRRLLNRETENYIPMNVFRMLPDRTGVLFRPGELATVLYVCWVPVTNKYETEKPPLSEPETKSEKVVYQEPKPAPVAESDKEPKPTTEEPEKTDLTPLEEMEDI
jgi:hypothetical protein